MTNKLHWLDIRFIYPRKRNNQKKKKRKKKQNEDIICTYKSFTACLVEFIFIGWVYFHPKRACYFFSGGLVSPNIYYSCNFFFPCNSLVINIVVFSFQKKKAPARPRPRTTRLNCAQAYLTTQLQQTKNPHKANIPTI